MPDCWWCCHSFESESLHMPYKICKKTNKILTMGHFCSWSCMKAFNINKHNDIKSSTINSMIYQLRGTTKPPIKPAPDRYALEKFGGTMTIEEFRKSDSTNTIVNFPNQIFRVHHVEKQNTSIYLKEAPGEHKMNEISKAPATNSNTLKLKRPKPLKRDVSNLELSMGITRKTSKPSAVCE
jgi:hypothetical protein